MCSQTQDREKPIIFSMARLDHVKNLTGLAEWFAKNKRLRQLCNLVIVGGIVDSSQTTGSLAIQNRDGLAKRVYSSVKYLGHLNIEHPSLRASCAVKSLWAELWTTSHTTGK